MIIEEVHEYIDGNQVLSKPSERPYEGYLPLYSSDVRKLIKYQNVNIRQFPGMDGSERIFLKHSTPDVAVFKKDIRILKEDLFKLQEYIGVRNNKDTTVKIIGRVDELMIQKRKALKRQRQKQSVATHDELFQSVTFKDMNFTFGGVQAEVIKQLYQAHQEGHPRIHFKILLKKAGSSSPFMRDIFRNKENWKKLIINDGRGYYWLHEDFFADEQS